MVWVLLTSYDLLYSPINIVAYYHEDESSLIPHFRDVCNSKARVKCIFYQVNEVIPINKLKNMGIDSVITSHFVFAECNLSPTSIFRLFLLRIANLYNDLLRTPGYLWREPTFVGVIPVYEWSSDSYEAAKNAYQYCFPIGLNYRNPDRVMNGPSSLQKCLRDYQCRPLQTTTIPMVHPSDILSN